MDFVAICLCKDIETNDIKYIYKEFYNNKGYYPKNSSEDIEELIKELKDDSDLQLFNLEILDITEIIDNNGISLWNEI